MASRELRQIVNRIAEINSEANQESEVDEATWSELLRSLRIEKKLLLDSADKLITEDGARVGPGAYLVLGFEYIQLGNAQMALRHVDKVEASASDKRDFDDAKRFRALAIYLPGNLRDLIEARALFSKLVGSMAFTTDPHTNEYLMRVYASWILAEATYGECEYVQNLYVKVSEEATERGIPQESANRSREGIKRNLALTKCRIE